MCEEQLKTEVSEDSLSDETEDQPVREKNRYALTKYLINLFFKYVWIVYRFCIILYFCINCSEFYFEIHTVILFLFTYIDATEVQILLSLPQPFIFIKTWFNLMLSSCSCYILARITRLLHHRTKCVHAVRCGNILLTTWSQVLN